MTRRTILKLAGLALVDALAGAGGGCGQGGPADSAAAAADPAASSTRPAQAAQEGQLVNQTVKVKVFNRRGELVGPVEVPRVVKTDEQWKAQLTAAQYRIARAKGTEPAFCGNLLDNHQKGVYACVCCGLPLFSSDSKFNSGTGWPSFFQPVAAENVIEHPDDGYGMRRTEILCARCDCHLGHVFDDGPRPTGLRFCVNSESLKFTPGSDLASLADPAAAAAESPPAPASQPARLRE